MALRFLLSLGDRYAPVLRSSKFKEEGKLTPEEFVVAGEQLVHTCGTWSWEAGDSSRVREYLNDSRKQYLITRNVPCRRRARPSAEDDDEKQAEGEDWTITHASMKKSEDDDIQDASEPATATTAATATAPPAKQLAALSVADHDDDDDDDDDDDIPDADDYLQSLGNQEVADPDEATLGPTSTSSTDAAQPDLEKHRTYDVSITYDNWYKTPRVFLLGYDEHGKPLTPDQMMEDISSDHAAKTATVEPHPHTGVPQVSIHPCQHAHVMKKFIDAYEADGKTIRVDQYMFLFIKCISAAIPTIDYDFTIDVESVRLDN